MFEFDHAPKRNSRLAEDPLRARACRGTPLKAASAYPTATGSAQYQSQPGQRELQLEVYRIRSLAGKSVVFHAGATKLGTGKVSATGIAQITRNSELGQSVPTIVHGSTVSVRTASGTLIASGRF